MAASCTAPAVDGASAAHTAPTVGSVPTSAVSTPKRGARAISERAVAVYSPAPITTGMPMSAPIPMPNGLAVANGLPTAAMPGTAMPAAAMPTNGAILYGSPCAGAVLSPTPTPGAMPGIGGAAFLPMGNMWAPPAAPRSVAAGIPDPTAIENYKSAHTQCLDDQLRHGEELLRMQQKQEIDYIRQAAEAQKKQLICQIDQTAKEQEMELSKKYAEKQMTLQREYQQQKLVLEKQAIDLSMEYQRKKAQEELLKQQYEMQKAHQEDNMRIASQRPSGEGVSPLCDAFFNMIDSNKDGVISKEEWQKAMTQAMHRGSTGKRSWC